MPIFPAQKAFIYSWSFHKPSKYYERAIINLVETVVVSRLGDISSLLHLGPFFSCGVEFINIRIIIIVVNSSKDDDLIAKHSWCVMGDVSGKYPFVSNLLPLSSEFWVQNEFLNGTDVELPHIIHWAFLNISSSVDIKAINGLNMRMANNKIVTYLSFTMKLQWFDLLYGNFPVRRTSLQRF